MSEWARKCKWDRFGYWVLIKEKKELGDRVGQTLLEYGREGFDIALNVQFHSCSFQRKSTHEPTAIFSPISDPMVFGSDYLFTSLLVAIPIVHKISCCHRSVVALLQLCHSVIASPHTHQKQKSSRQVHLRAGKKTMFLMYAGTCKRSISMPKTVAFLISPNAVYFSEQVPLYRIRALGIGRFGTHSS